MNTEKELIEEIDWKCEYYNKVKELESFKNTYNYDRCWLCGTKENLTKHHLQQVRERTLNLRTIPLCKNCHINVEELRKEKLVKRLRLEAYDKGFQEALAEKGLIRVEDVEEMIDNMGTFRCGYMTGIEGCERIDKEELKQQLKKLGEK